MTESPDLSPTERLERLTELRAASIKAPLTDEEVTTVVGLFYAVRADQAAASGRKIEVAPASLDMF